MRRGWYVCRRIEEGIDLLAQGDYWGYNQHCIDCESDARDVGSCFAI